MLVAVLVGCTLFLGTARPAAAAVPCWKQLLNDWYDGRIDHTYPIPCYRQALDHLPTDVQVYSSARDDIQRALASAIRNKNRPKSGGSTTPAPPVTGTGRTGTGRTSTGTRTRTGTLPSKDETPTAPTVTNGRESSNGPFGEAIDKINPGSADSLPLPLLILGGLALLLVGAGVAGLVVRRVQARGPGL